MREQYAAHTFIGTLSEKELDFLKAKGVTPEGVQSIVTMERTRDFRESILQSDVIIYDLITNTYEEIDYVIKTLKSSLLQT